MKPRIPALVGTAAVVALIAVFPLLVTDPSATGPWMPGCGICSPRARSSSRYSATASCAFAKAASMVGPSAVVTIVLRLSTILATLLHTHNPADIYQ